PAQGEAAGEGEASDSPEAAEPDAANPANPAAEEAKP
ncbi:hypothetical protein PPSIR1_39235, partial [Plesiocystis pacifica SIR-1]